MKTISPTDLKAKKVCLIDVREPAEHRSEYISECHLIPLSEICCSKLPETSLPIVLYCHSGRRSEEACRKLLSQNPELDVCSLKGGIVAWKKAGFKMITSEKQILPLDRQVQFLSGTLCFFGILLGTFVSVKFYALSGFIGLGLMFAGLTGWCGMAKFLAKMPWNQ